MYDRAETAGPNDRFWAQIAMALRAQGLTAPEALTRGPAAYWPAWEAPSLVLSQTCGFPFRARLKDRVALVAETGPEFARLFSVLLLIEVLSLLGNYY